MKLFAIAALIMSASALRLSQAPAENQGPPSPARLEAQALKTIKIMDTSGDKKISLDELIAFVRNQLTEMCKVKSDYEPEECKDFAATMQAEVQMLTGIFAKVDKDGNGKIDINELIAVMSGPPPADSA